MVMDITWPWIDGCKGLGNAQATGHALVNISSGADATAGHTTIIAVMVSLGVCPVTV